MYRIPDRVDALEAFTATSESKGEHITSILPWAGEFVIHTTKPKTTATAAQTRETRAKAR